MPDSNSPPGGAAQPDVEAESRHSPVEAAGAGPPSPGAPSPSDFGRPGFLGPDVERGPDPLADKPAGGWSSQHPHVFHLSTWAPSTYDGGTLQGAIAGNWPLLAGQQASVYLARLEIGAVREPHWHPSAWELNFVISGQARWSVVGPQATHDAFEAEKGDLVFAPQGHFHYFENASETEELVVLIVFNASAGEPDDDIGLVESLSAIPPEVLGAMFKTSPEAFKALPHKLERVTIARKPG